MSGIYKVTRRDFLRYTGIGAGALVLGCHIGPTQSLLKDIVHNGLPLNNFLSIELDGTVVIVSHRSEMGQGIKSSLAAVMADELGADWSRVRLRQADADGPKYAIGNSNPDGKPSYLIPEDGSQFADSSRSMALYFTPMRLFGAGTRLVLVRAAALKVWRVDPAECEGRDHKVWHKPTGRSIDYRELPLFAATVGIPQLPEIQAALKKPQQWVFIGKKMPFYDAKDMVTGKAVYGADVAVDRPGMLTAMIVRCPVANGDVKSFDDSAARQVPGVVDVVKVRIPHPLLAGGVGAGFMPHAGVAVVAANTWAALQGRRALKGKVEWELGPNATYNSEDFRRELKASTDQAGNKLRSRGDVDAAFATPAKVVEAEYYVPHLAQAPMEPPVTIALYENGRWEIWSPTQGPELAQHYVGLAMLEPDPEKWLAWQVTDPSEVRECEREANRIFNEHLGRALGLDLPGLIQLRDRLKKEVRDRVKVHVTLLGGGFGRKSKPDYAIEAAFLARLHPGVPIRVQWTREDDIKFSYFNSVNHQYLKAALDADGRPTALLQRSAFSSFFATLFSPPFPGVPDTFPLARKAFHNGGEYPYGSAIERAHGLEDMPFKMANLRIENCPAQSHIRCGWMRSVANIYHAFSICSFADEMAVAAGRDGKDYLLEELIGEGGKLDLEAEGAPCFDNNGFPAKMWEGTPAVIPPYPPDTRRLRAVVERVARESGWDEKVKKYKQMKGRGLGIAAHRSFLSYVAIVVDVSLNDAHELTINEIYGVIDCGMAVNPDRVSAQMEGGIIYGLSYALLGEITVKDGAVEQNNFDDYPVLRIHQTPKKIITYVQEPSAEVAKDFPNHEVPPTGAGEPPTPAVAPALANAIFAAGGPRIREIPFYKKVVVL